jgi:plastocyanin
MKEFFNRNKPVFVIGLLTLITFIALIVTSFNKRPENENSPKMIKLLEQEEMELEMEIIPSSGYLDPSETTQSEDAARLFDRANEPLEIEYRVEGFLPVNARVRRGQLVRWVNRSSNDMILLQTSKIYPEWKEPVVVKRNGSYEFRMYKSGMFTYKDLNSTSFGSVFVFDKKP